MTTIRLMISLITWRISSCDRENTRSNFVTESGVSDRSREVVIGIQYKTKKTWQRCMCCDGGETCLLYDCTNTRRTNNPNMQSTCTNTFYVPTHTWRTKAIRSERGIWIGEFRYTNVVVIMSSLGQMIIRVAYKFVCLFARFKTVCGEKRWDIQYWKRQ